MFAALLTIACAVEPIPDRLVVLTFDDASKSHYTVARPILKKHGFGATFFVTEGFDFPTNKRDYMTWAEIAELHRDGFEIGNHTRDHLAVSDATLGRLEEQLAGIDRRCLEHGIPKPVSFAYPGNGISKGGLAILERHGIHFARRGGAPEHVYERGQGFAYEPGLDHHLLIPSAGDARPAWTLADFERAVKQARGGRIAVLQFHGVPDAAHGWVNVTQPQFERFMQYLKDERYRALAMRDLAKYVDRTVTPNNPWGVVEDRKKLVEKQRSPSVGRKPADDAERRYWLENAVVGHGMSESEAAAALDLAPDEVHADVQRLHLKAGQPSDVGARRVLPYPGGRHPRLGFLDGAIRPQRETKFSVFPPWKEGGYVVVDFPEAIWFNRTTKPEDRELLYLAHTHVPTYWDKRERTLPMLEWRRTDGELHLERAFPELGEYTAEVRPTAEGVRLRFTLTNRSAKKWTGLAVQMCAMLGRLRGFEERTNANKIFAPPFAACRDGAGKRWTIFGFERCGRAWGNPPCPCLHSDPALPDLAPGETAAVRGWLSFFEGADVHAELQRLRTKLAE
jgi:peptidoglycan/xylan/chitin deacetylase (PgdA/CDA1 family)